MSLEFDELQKLRQEVRDVDRQILALAAKRQRLAQEIGQIKLAQGLPIKDFAVEKAVLDSSRKISQELGLYEELGHELISSLIKYSVLTQDEFHRRQSQLKVGQEKKILVIGGLGRMGQWQANFFASFGHHVKVFDPKGDSKTHSIFPIVKDLAREVLDAHVIVLATPIEITSHLIQTLIDLKTDALIFDICSLKTPLLTTIKKAAQKGLKITSVHPMFGPEVDTLSGRNIIICHVHDLEATKQTFDLFQGTTAALVSLTLEEHDLLMSYVLGLSHLVNLVFARTLHQGPFAYGDLKNVASTTFHSQLRVTLPVISENKDLYYTIQSANEFTPALLNAFEKAFEDYKNAILNQNKLRFSDLMTKSQEYFQAPEKQI